MSTQQEQENARSVPDPFPLLGLGSGNETRYATGSQLLQGLASLGPAKQAILITRPHHEASSSEIIAAKLA